MVAFNNTASPLKRLVMRRFGHGLPHFLIETDRGRIAYAFIRKNASSAFTRLILRNLSGTNCLSAREVFAIMIKRFHLKTTKSIRNCDFRLFVYRHPIDRVASLFKNKFIQRSGNKSIFANYHAITNSNPRNATFRDFVQTYLRKDWTKLDIHALPQVEHLAAVQYTNAIFINDVYEEMAEIIGQNLTRTFFGSSVNASNTMPFADSGGKLARTSSEFLHKIYCDTGTLPRISDLMDSELEDRICNLYADDVAMVDELARVGTCSHAR